MGSSCRRYELSLENIQWEKMQKMDNEDNIPTPKDINKLKKVFEDDGYNKMNEAIGRMLKRLRKEHNMTVKDVKQRLHDDYGVDVAEKTLYNWES